MAASMKKIFFVLGQNFNNLPLSSPYFLTVRQINLCNKCISRYSTSSWCVGPLYADRLSQKPVLYSHRRTVLLRGGKSGSNFKGSRKLWKFQNGNSSTEYQFRTLFEESQRFAHCQNRYISGCSKLQKEENFESLEQDLKKDGIQGEVKENIKTIPNMLTLGRILSTPLIGYLVVHQSFTWALGLFVCAGITDMLDGVIARNFKNQMSALGTALDPLADKILITVLTVTLTTANLLPVPLAVLIIGRDVLLVAAAFYIRFISLPPPRTLSRYFDVTNPTAKLLPSTLSKINTILQLVLVSFTLAAPVFDFVDHPALKALWYITGATTFGSGVGYIWSRNSYVKFLKKGMGKNF